MALDVIGGGATDVAVCGLWERGSGAACGARTMPTHGGDCTAIGCFVGSCRGVALNSRNASRFLVMDVGLVINVKI